MLLLIIRLARADPEGPRANDDVARNNMPIYFQGGHIAAPWTDWIGCGRSVQRHGNLGMTEVFHEIPPL
jgi:hypothetical protein